MGREAEISVSLEIPGRNRTGILHQRCDAARQASRRKPRRVAEEIVAALREEDRRGRFASLSIAGPGFINIVLSEEFLEGSTDGRPGKGPRFGASKIGEGKTVHLEFVSANPTGPLTWSGRGARRPVTPWLGSRVHRHMASVNITSTTSGNQMDNLGRSLSRDTEFCADERETPRGWVIAGST